jgi:hypothetical protein
LCFLPVYTTVRGWSAWTAVTTLRPCTRCLQLEYCSIDCHLRGDGHLLLFEASPKLNVLHNIDQNARYRVHAVVKQIHSMLTRSSGEKVF